VALCSRKASVEGARRRAQRHGASLIAIDFARAPKFPTFITSGLLGGTPFHWDRDTSLKRNVGLVLARVLDWRRIVFLDDDIADVDPDHIRAAAGLLNTYNVVALENVGFPDNSVVCHALRKTGVYQDSFVGGGAMAVATDRVTSFFPNTYNEDWFFLIDNESFRPTAITGKVSQERYDPYAGPARAEGEEFGDSIAEGIYSLLDEGGSLRDADQNYWSAFLDDRRRLIAEVLAAIPGLDVATEERDRMAAAMEAAQARQLFIKPQLCVEYLEAWMADRVTWETYLRQLPRDLTLQQALKYLGLSSKTFWDVAGRRSSGNFRWWRRPRDGYGYPE
jgi:hypothetical protein